MITVQDFLRRFPGEIEYHAQPVQAEQLDLYLTEGKLMTREEGIKKVIHDFHHAQMVMYAAGLAGGNAELWNCSCPGCCGVQQMLAEQGVDRDSLPIEEFAGTEKLK